MEFLPLNVLTKGCDTMDFFGNIKIGTWFSQFNSWHIFKKVDENFAVSSNGELIAFTPNAKVYVIK